MASHIAVNSSFQLNLKELNSMDKVIENTKSFEGFIVEIQKRYHTIDVSVAMNSLVLVGKVLKLAYASSKGFPCSKNTMYILCNYQSLIKNSFVTSSSFVDSCLSALKYHKHALTLADKDNFESALSMIHKCSEEAGKMANESGKLAEEATKLCKLAEDALESASCDETLSRKEKEKIKSIIFENKVKQDALRKKREILDEQINEVKEEQEKLSQSAEKEIQRQFVLKMVSSIMCPLLSTTEKAVFTITKVVSDISNKTKDVEKTNVSQHNVFIEQVETLKSRLKDLKERIQNSKNDNKPDDEIKGLINEEKELETKLDKLRHIMIKNDNCNSAGDVNTINPLNKIHEKEMFIMNLKSELQKEEREGNSEIVEIASRLKGLTNNNNDLSRSINSLEMAIKALGKIKTTFELTKQYWEGVRKHCEKLKDKSILEALNSPDVKEDFIQELKDSALSWLALGKMSYKAMLSMKNVDAEADEIMNNLPTKEEAERLIKTLNIKEELDEIVDSVPSLSKIFFIYL